MKNNKKGFTIVELVIVIAVIAILAAVLIPTFSGVIGKANQSAAQQTATNSLKAGLLMTNTATLPKDTLVLVDSDKAANTDPDYGYVYNGNALEEKAIYDNGNFVTSLVTGADTLLINDTLITDTSIDAVLSNMVAVALGLKGTAATAEKVDGNYKLTVGTRTFTCYTSVDMPKNVVIFVDMNSNDNAAPETSTETSTEETSN